MFTLTPLVVPDVIGELSAPLDLTLLDMSSPISIQLSGNAVDGDGIVLYGSLLNTLAVQSDLVHATQVGMIGTSPVLPAIGINPLPNRPLSTGGQAPDLVNGPLYRYLYAYRAFGTTTGLTLLATGEADAAGGGGGGNPNALLQGGNQFGAGIVAGSLDAETVTLQSQIGTGAALLLTPTGGVSLVGNLLVAIGSTVAGKVLALSGQALSLIEIGPGALSIRNGQVTYAVSDFATPGDCQSWDFILKGATPGVASGETVVLNLSLENNKCYRIDWESVAYANSTGVNDILSNGTQGFTCVQVGGTITQVGAGTALASSSAGAGASWTQVLSITGSAGSQVLTWTFTDVGSTEVVRVQVRLRVMEVLHA